MHLTAPKEILFFILEGQLSGGPPLPPPPSLLIKNKEESVQGETRMGGSLLFKAEVPGSSLLGHLSKEFSLRLTWCPWLVRYYGTRGISRGTRKLYIYFRGWNLFKVLLSEGSLVCWINHPFECS